MKLTPPLLPTLFLPLFLLVLLGSAAAQPPAEREWIPYRKLLENSRLNRFYALPAVDRDKLDMFIHLQASRPSDLRAKVLTVVRDGRRTPLPIDADGALRPPPDPSLLVDDAMIMTTLPEDIELSVAPAMNALVPPGLRWPYAQLLGSVPQANVAIERISGPFSVFSTARAVILKFAEPARLTIQSANGTRQHATDAKHQIRLQPDAALLAENPLMLVTSRPFEAELSSD